MPTEVFHNVDCFIEHGLLPAHQLPEDVTDCSICATPYNTDCTIPVYTACGHLFCKDCIRRWARTTRNSNGVVLKTNNTCPMCRTQLFIESGGRSGDRNEVTIEFREATATARRPALNQSLLPRTFPSSELTWPGEVHAAQSPLHDSQHHPRVGRHSHHPSPYPLPRRNSHYVPPPRLLHEFPLTLPESGVTVHDWAINARDRTASSPQLPVSTVVQAGSTGSLPLQTIQARFYGQQYVPETRAVTFRLTPGIYPILERMLRIPGETFLEALHRSTRPSETYDERYDRWMRAINSGVWEEE